MGSGVIAFNFLRSSAPPAVITRNVQIALFLLFAALVVSATALTIEQARVREAQNEERAYAARYEKSVQALRRARVSVSQAQMIIGAQETLSRAIYSGDGAARRLAQLGGVLPPHTWITSLEFEGNRLHLQGGTVSLAHLAQLLRGLSDLRGLSSAQLATVHAVSATARFHYEIDATTEEASP